MADATRGAELTVEERLHLEFPHRIDVVKSVLDICDGHETRASLCLHLGFAFNVHPERIAHAMRAEDWRWFE